MFIALHPEESHRNYGIEIENKDHVTTKHFTAVHLHWEPALPLKPCMLTLCIQNKDPPSSARQLFFFFLRVYESFK